MNTKDLAPQRKALVGPAGAAMRTLYDGQKQAAAEQIPSERAAGNDKGRRELPTQLDAERWNSNFLSLAGVKRESLDKRPGRGRCSVRSILGYRGRR